MVQEQLVDYITSQQKTGLSTDAIKAALIAAGWQAADVDDTIKKVNDAAMAVKPAASVATITTTTSTATTSTKTEPQTIRVSDLVSGAGMAASTFSSPEVKTTKTQVTNTYVAPAGATEYHDTSYVKKSKGPLTTEIILGVLMIVFAILAVFLYFENSGLKNQVATLNGQNSSASSQASLLQQQLNASTTDLSSQLSAANTMSAQLALDLSFYAVPPDASDTATSTNVLMGSVMTGAKGYVIMTQYGAKILVANSKDPKVVAAVQPLVGSTTVQFGGTYVPGSDAITLTVVNGNSLIAPVVASSTTATTTSSSASTTMMTASGTPATTTAQ